MKREGYQHGMVRCHYILPDLLNPRPETRYLNRFDSPPTAGLFTRVSTKPTNHSKFTGKCGRPKCRGCHENPAYKSKDKKKGTQKLRFGTGLNRSGFSATGYLAQMDDDDEEEDCVDEVHEKSCEVASLAVDIEGDDGCVDEVDGKSFEVASLAVDIEGGDEDDGCVDEVYGKSCDLTPLAGDIKSVDNDATDKICDMQFDDEDEDWCFVEETS